MNWLTHRLGVRYPILLGPMRGITLSQLTASVSNSGGFGQLASSGLSPDQLREEIRKTHRLTQRPFGLNIPLHRPNVLELIEIAAEMDIKIITTSGGNPAKIMQRAKTLGIFILHKVSTTSMGLKAQDAGVDAVIATGFEAGGHGGKEQITTLCLVPQLVDELKIPVIAAGGISDGRTFTAALALGAVGVEMGTRFLASQESPVSDHYKQAIVQARDDSTTCLGHGSMSMRVLRKPTDDVLVRRTTLPKKETLVSEGDSVVGAVEQKIWSAGMGAGMIHQIEPVREIIHKMLMEAAEISSGLVDLFN